MCWKYILEVKGMSSKKYVYLFEEGNAGMKNLLGGKGANLAEMTKIGLPVPPGLIVTTEACKDFTAQGQQFPAGLKEQIRNGIALLEENGEEVWRRGQSTAGISPFRCSCFHARDDGYSLKPRFK